MKTNAKLESYLEILARALGQIPVSDRAEIITEIKSHVLTLIEKDPAQSVESILSSIGEPEVVANRYLLERGLKPGKPSKTPMIKWLTIGFLGTFGFASLVFIFAVWKMTPLFEIDERNERVEMLGGLIKINGSEASIKIGESEIFFDDEAERVHGTMAIDLKTSKVFSSSFKNGKVMLQASSDNRLHWDCQIKDLSHPLKPIVADDVVEFALSDYSGVKCLFKVPAFALLKIKGLNGKIHFEAPVSDVDADIGNGAISFYPNPSKAYRYDVQVLNGKRDAFISSESSKAHKIELSVGNGKIGMSTKPLVTAESDIN